MLVDSFGREIVNLRISVTDRCTCDAPTAFRRRRSSGCRVEEILTFEEIERFVCVVAALGIRKLRLTGGEPLLRRDLPELVRRLVAVPGIVDVGMTTNGTALGRLAAPLRAAGLSRLNVSLDTLDRELFKKMTRRDSLDAVLEGLEAAAAAGFAPIKVNAVDRARQERRRDRAARQDGPRARPRAALHRVHADRRGERLGRAARRAQRGGPGDSRHDLAARAGRHSGRDRLRRGAGAGSTARARSGSSAASRSRFATAATASASRRRASYARASSRSWSTTSARSCAAAPTTRRSPTSSCARWRRRSSGHKIGRPDFVKPIRTMSSIGG